MHSAMDHDCDLNARFGKPSCMTEFRQEVIEDCIEAVEGLFSYGAKPDAWQALFALRALLPEGSAK